MVSLDRVFELLSEERRRYALFYLEEQDGAVPVEDVAEKVAEWEVDGAPASIPEQMVTEIELELFHEHLPKSSEADYIEYNRQERVIEVSDTPPDVDAILKVARVIERPDRNP